MVVPRLQDGFVRVDTCGSYYSAPSTIDTVVEVLERVSTFDLDLDVPLDLESDFALIASNNDYYGLDCMTVGEDERSMVEPSVLDSALMVEVRAGGQYVITVVSKAASRPTSSV